MKTNQVPIIAVFAGLNTPSRPSVHASSREVFVRRNLERENE
jgi:hypothetical protein